MLGLPNSPIKAAALLLASTSYIAVGVAHFTHVDFFLSIMPPYLPYHLELVWISGVAEIAGGIGLLIPRLRQLTSWCLIALLFAVYPANIHMMMNPEQFADLGPPIGLYLRMPMQFVFMAWAWWVGSPDKMEVSP